jgi:hypothetical protein
MQGTQGQPEAGETWSAPLADAFDFRAATIDGVRASVQRWLRPSAFRQFYLRMLDPEADVHEAFVQVSAIHQLALLTRQLLAGLVETPLHVGHVLEASKRMNAWQVHEVVSDNLALGLGHPAEVDDAADQARRTLLRVFNNAMAGRLRGAGAMAMPDFRELAGDRVRFSRSALAPEVHASLIARFSTWSGIPAREVEASAPDQLAANIESCLDMLGAMVCAPLAGAARASLIGRYDGVNELLAVCDLPFDQLLRSGTHTILVLPTLAFYVDALSTCLDLEDRLECLAQSWVDALELAAALVRLLNDVGTDLLEMEPPHRAKLCGALRAAAHASPDLPLARSLREPTAAIPALTRLRKDIEHDEFNLALHGIGHRSAGADAMPELEARLESAAAAFCSGRQRLHRLLERLDEQMGDPRTCLLVRRFVGFHERLYRHAYDSRSGDYAVY